MAYFAQIDKTNTVTQVIAIANDVVPDPAPENENLGQDFIANTLGLPGTWLQTSYHGNFRGTYAGIGYTYDATLDEFVAPTVEEPLDE
jgi:hypothetical protein